MLSAYEVSLLLGQSIHAVFVSPFKKRQARANLRVCVISGVLILHKNYCTVVISRIVFGVRCQCNAEGIVFSMSIYWQVTGCVLGCMSDVKDVHEYLQNEVKAQAAITVKVRRLLRYINQLDRQEKQKQSVSMVRMHHRSLPIFDPMSSLELSGFYNIFESTSASASASQHRVR